MSLTSQGKDIDAINAYFVRTPAMNSAANTIRNDWNIFYNGLSTWEKNTNSDTYAKAKRKRDDFNAAQAKTVPANATTAPAVPPGAKPTLRQGSTGPYVVELQKVVGATPYDGKFGPNTRSKLMTFQRNNGLVVDGIAGPATWAKIDALLAKVNNSPAPVSQAANTAAAMVAAQPPPAPVKPPSQQLPTPPPPPVPSVNVKPPASPSPPSAKPQPLPEPMTTVEQVVNVIDAAPMWQKVGGGILAGALGFFGIRAAWRVTK